MDTNTMTDTTITISMWLKKSGPRLNFCMICREAIKAQFEGTPGELLVGIDASYIGDDSYRPLKFPIRIKCSGHSQRYGKCPAIYVIQGFIEE